MTYPVSNPTVNDMITLCLQDAGIIGQGQEPVPEDSTNALARLNWMLAAWRRQRWLVYNLRNYSIVSTGAQIYTVGPGGDIDTDGAVVVHPALAVVAFQRLVQAALDLAEIGVLVLAHRIAHARGWGFLLVQGESGGCVDDLGTEGRRSLPAGAASGLPARTLLPVSPG